MDIFDEFDELFDDSIDEYIDCDDFEDRDDFLDEYDGCMPDGSDADDYWDNW